MSWATRPSVSVAAEAGARKPGATGTALAASAMISMPPGHDRLVTIIASSPSAFFTFCNTSRDVLPTNLVGVMLYSRLRT